MDYFYYPEKGGLGTIEKHSTISCTDDYDGCIEYTEEIDGDFNNFLKSYLGMISTFILLCWRREGAYELIPPEGWELDEDEFNSFEDYLDYHGIDDLLDNGWEAEPYHYGEEIEREIYYYNNGNLYDLTRV